ncbi:MAG: glutamate 5-kinase [Lachnospiraceae bacterium]|nr:glutamate 5-kinase [Lachnospiraceae bacterium]
MMQINDYFKYKKRLVVKIGSSSLHHPETGKTDFTKIDKLVRELCDIRNCGIDVCLVSSGAIAVGRNTIGMAEKPDKVSTRQALAAVGQAHLISTYQRMFSSYNQTAAQVLLTKNTVLDPVAMQNAKNTMDELFQMGIIPVVNENDTTSIYEIKYGDNDTLSAIVASLIGADSLILLSDIDGLYTDDPRQNPQAKLVEVVKHMDDQYFEMAKGTTGSSVGTGGMSTKMTAARIATASGADMIIANGKDVGILHEIFDGDFVGTMFYAEKDENFELPEFVREWMHDKH